MSRNKFFFYFLSFLEGASVMAAELLGAKMLAPYFGSSLYVWASVLGITLGGLAMGYFMGGIFSRKKNNEANLYAVLLVSAIFLIVMPLAAKNVMIHTAGFSLLTSILISSLIFLFPPVFFMGMVSPMIVECIAPPTHRRREYARASYPLPSSTKALHPSHGFGEGLPRSAEAGFAEAMREGESGDPDSYREEGVSDSPLRGAGGLAGSVYAISTVGGILSTFLLGFYIIPEFGLTKPAIVMGIILGIIPFIKLITGKKFFSLIFLLAVFFSFRASPSPLVGDGVRLLYSSEGLLGQIIVADYPLYEKEKKVDGSQRILFVNRSTQTVVTYKKGEKTFFEYVNLIEEKTRYHALLPSPLRWKTESVRLGGQGKGKGERQKALVLGLGGGSVANKLCENGFDVDAVELDKRMYDCAKKYFDLNEKVNVNIDDARHFVKTPPSPRRGASARASSPLPSSTKALHPSHGFGEGLPRSAEAGFAEAMREGESGDPDSYREEGASEFPLQGVGELYSVIVLDAFIGEVNPHHLFTTEFFSEVKHLLSDSGMFFVNGNGYWDGEAGKGMRAVCKTLINSGFDVEVIPTNEAEDYRNLLFLAKPVKASVGQITWDKSLRKVALDSFGESFGQISDAIILTDEKPQLEILNAEANKRWREACMKYFLSGYYSGQDKFVFR